MFKEKRKEKFFLNLKAKKWAKTKLLMFANTRLCSIVFNLFLVELSDLSQNFCTFEIFVVLISTF